MFKLRTPLVLVLALVAGSLAGRALLRPAPEPVTRAAWKDIYSSSRQMTADVDAIVLATFDASEPGRVLPGDGPGEVQPFILNHFTVDEALKGDLAAGDPLTVEQTADMATDGTLAGIDSDGGSYAPGQQALLFLKAQPGQGTYYVVSYQGRYNVVGGTLYGVHAHDPVVDELEHQTVGASLDVIAGELSANE